MFKRKEQDILAKRLEEKRQFIQVLQGPRQVGKTTMAKDVFDSSLIKNKLFISADEPTLNELASLDDLWKRHSDQVLKSQQDGLLVIDEVHKYPDWEKAVKARWDADTNLKVSLKVVLLGSAPLLIQKGLAESLSGRFEVIYVTHWKFQEVHSAFHVDLEKYVYLGGYPGPYNLIGDEGRWKSYIRNSLIETTIARDVMLLTRIDKPALLRQLFYLACEYSGQILSYQKMTGQLQDAGNTTTLAHYLNLLSAVGFVTGLQKFSGSKVRSRSSSPKLQVYNTALLSALSHETYEKIKSSSEMWGRWVESAVGAHLLNQAEGSGVKVEYWKDGNYEVDFILIRDKQIVAIEVKSGRKQESLSGLSEFKKKFNVHRMHVVGLQGISLEEFFKSKIEDLF